MMTVDGAVSWIERIPGYGSWKERLMMVNSRIADGVVVRGVHQRWGRHDVRGGGGV